MKMYPNGHEEESKDYVSIFLSLFLDKRNKTNEEVKAKFQFSIHKLNGDEFKSNIGGTFTLRNSCIKCNNAWPLIKREELLNEENGYLDGDRLTIVCSLTIIVIF
jgi:hypothetical protein